jgi:DNA primase large subunit
MEKYDLNTLARFPFLDEAVEYIKNLNLSLDVILDSLAYSIAWERGKQRLVESLEQGKVLDHGPTTDAENINELLSYVIARIIISVINDIYLVRRYALSEAVYFYKGLQEKDTRFLGEVAKQFELTIHDINGEELNLSIIDYLKYSTKIRAPEYKLVNREVNKGLVKVTKRELARLIQEALRSKIQLELPIMVEQQLKDKITPKIRDIITLTQTRKKKFEVHDLGKISIIRFPPCIKQLLGMTQAGENVPHVGRFALASFLHHIGLSSDQILTLFSTSPDFDVEKARYQVEHITGERSGTEYTPPGCDTMKSNGICFNPDTLCNKDWMNHPLSYYRIKGKKKREEIIQNKKKKEEKTNGKTNEL